MSDITYQDSREAARQSSENDIGQAYTKHYLFPEYFQSLRAKKIKTNFIS
jgi:hypothetical protein